MSSRLQALDPLASFLDPTMPCGAITRTLLVHSLALLTFEALLIAAVHALVLQKPWQAWTSVAGRSEEGQA